MFMYCNVGLWLKLSVWNVSERRGEKEDSTNANVHNLPFGGETQMSLHSISTFANFLPYFFGLYVKDISSKHVYFSCKMLGKLSGPFFFFSVSNLWSLFSYIWAVNKYKWVCIQVAALTLSPSSSTYIVVSVCLLHNTTLCTIPCTHHKTLLLASLVK